MKAASSVKDGAAFCVCYFPVGSVVFVRLCAVSVAGMELSILVFCSYTLASAFVGSSSGSWAWGAVTDTHVTHHFLFSATTSLFYFYTLNFSFFKCTSVTR